MRKRLSGVEIDFSIATVLVACFPVDLAIAIDALIHRGPAISRCGPIPVIPIGSSAVVIGGIPQRLRALAPSITLGISALHGGGVTKFLNCVAIAAVVRASLESIAAKAVCIGRSDCRHKKNRGRKAFHKVSRLDKWFKQIRMPSWQLRLLQYKPMWRINEALPKDRWFLFAP